MSTLGNSSAASVTTASYYRANETIFELTIDIDKYIATEDALDINGDERYRNVEGDGF